MTTESKAWLTRSGRYGERDTWALETGVTPGGFGEVGDLAACASLDDVRVRVVEAYPEMKPQAMTNFAAQLWSLAGRMAAGDLVVLPRKSTSQLAIGRITGPYEYRAAAPDIQQRHVRPVEWLRADVPRSAVKQDLLSSLGASLTYCEVSRHEAAERIAALAQTGVDPGSDASLTEALTPTGVPHTVGGLAIWATRIIDSIDIDAVEHEYKRAAAEAMAIALERANSGSPGWGDDFRRALNKTNILSFYFADDLKKAINADPQGALQTLNLLWDDPSPDRLDKFQQSLGALLGKVTPGNATALGSLLLLAADVESNAPYSPSRTLKWYSLTGFEGPAESSSATSRYSTMLSFLDTLASELEGDLDNRPSRLETQGAAWATTENAIPEGWDESEKRALQIWRGQSAEATRAWLMRAQKVATADWLTDGYVSLAATNLGDVTAGSDLKAIKAAVESGYQHVDYLQRKELAKEYHSFLSAMEPGDVVAIQADDVVHLGMIDSNPQVVDGAVERLQRAVAWQATVATERLPADVRGLFDLQGTVVDITQALEQLREIMTDGVIELLPRDSPTAVARSTLDLTPGLTKVTAKLAERLHLPMEALQEIVDLLESRQQIVLYGPPGTGKTFLAMALARHVAGPDDRSRVQLVQFHPSYAYEDFFEGFRPKETDQGQATFELTAGPLRRIAKDAKQNPDKPYVLVIDELNRANLAKVFGELYFLLEYRTESIQLQYNPTEAFQLPRNLFFIGTMNTADRSIALLDAAMRRRFSFVELHPDEPPVRDVLANWLAAKGQSNQRAVLLAALNDAIEDQDRDMRIGPSYLMKDEASTDQGLERVWKYDILPLLEEHYYGRLTRDQVRDRFGLDALLRGSPAVGEGEPEVLLTGDGSSDDLSD